MGAYSPRDLKMGAYSPRDLKMFPGLNYSGPNDKG